MANSSVKNLNIDGNVIISGSTTSIDVQQLTTDDNNITLNDIASPTDSNANAGGLTLKGTTDHTFNWLNATDSWTASEHIDIVTGKEYKINNTSVLNATTLGAGIVNSSLTDVGTLTSLQVDLLYLDGSQIGLKTTDEDLITLTNNTVTVAGTVAATLFTASATPGFTGDGSGLTGISTAGITSPGTDGQILYSDGATGWGGYTSVPLTAGGTGGTSAATAASNLGLGTTDSPLFGGAGTGSITIDATPSAGPTAPTFSGITMRNIPVPSGSGHKWVTGIEQNGNLAFSYFTINDAGANTSSAVGYITADPGNTRIILGQAGSTPVNVIMSGLSYPTADGTANQVLTTNGSNLLNFATPVTTNITEGTNLYYTDARADARVTAGFAAKSTTNLSEGTNLYFTDARAIAALNWANLNNRAGASGPATINVGENAGVTSQGTNAVAIGKDAGKTTQGAQSVAIGWQAGSATQGANSVAIGYGAAQTSQNGYTVAVGRFAGNATQGGSAVAIGNQAGQTTQGNNAVAVGQNAGQNSQGNSAIAIGKQAGETNQGANSIVLSATGATFSPTTASAFFVNPVRNVAGTTYLQYNNTTKEVTHIAATTSSVAEGTNLYYTDARADARATLRIAAASIGNLSDVTITTPATNSMLQYNGSAWIDAVPTTAHVTEGANLYYTDARADARIVNAGSANWNTAYTATNAATEADSNSTLVKRGSTGNIAVSKLTANNGIVLGDMPSAATGGIQWSGTDFLGYKDGAWVSLTSAASAQLSGAAANFVTSPTVTSTSYVDIAGYTTSINVTASNIINIQVNVDLDGPESNAHSFVKLVRVVSGTPTDLYEDESGSSAAGEGDHFNISYADTHGQSNGTVITYKLMAKVTAGTLTVNPNGTNAQIFAYEITTTPTTVASVNGASGTVVLDTDDINEGSTNLYYTNARADARIGAAQLSALANVHTAAPTDGQVLKWDNSNTRWAPAADTDTVYSSFNSDFDTRLATKTTANLAEGSNLYYTDARADARAQIKIDALIDSAPGALNTLNELAAALGDDANYAATVTTALATKEPTITAAATTTYWRGDKSFQTLNTAIVPEVTNLYYTDARADARVTPAAVSDEANTSTGAFIIPTGTTAQRPGSPAIGMMRFNTTTVRFEGYNGSAWVPIDTLYS